MNLFGRAERVKFVLTAIFSPILLCFAFVSFLRSTASTEDLQCRILIVHTHTYGSFPLSFPFLFVCSLGSQEINSSTHRKQQTLSFRNSQNSLISWSKIETWRSLHSTVFTYSYAFYFLSWGRVKKKSVTILILNFLSLCHHAIHFIYLNFFLLINTRLITFFSPCPSLLVLYIIYCGL